MPWPLRCPGVASRWPHGQVWPGKTIEADSADGQPASLPGEGLMYSGCSGSGAHRGLVGFVLGHWSPQHWGGHPMGAARVKRAVRSLGMDRVGRVCWVGRSSLCGGVHTLLASAVLPRGYWSPRLLPSSENQPTVLRERGWGKLSLSGGSAVTAWSQLGLASFQGISVCHPPVAVMSGGGTSGRGRTLAGALLMAVPAPSAPVLTMRSPRLPSHSS